MANAFVKAQFMEPPSAGGEGPVPVGAVRPGPGITISNDGVISLDGGSGIINEIICTNGITGGGSSPQVIIGLLPPTADTIGGVKTVAGSNISIDSNGVIRAEQNFLVAGGQGIQVSSSTNQAIVSLKPAGEGIPSNLGGVYAIGGVNGLGVAGDGALSLLPATPSRLGGVKAGTGVSITADGTLNATGSGGTITGVAAGTGLGGGGVSGAVTLYLRTPNGTTIGGVYAGDNVTIDPDGKLNLNAQAGVQTITATTPLSVTTPSGNPTISVAVATNSNPGVVQLTDDPTNTSTALAPSAFAMSVVNQVALNSLPKAGGTMSGDITFTAGQTFPGTVNSGAYTQLGGILVGDTSPPGYAQLPLGASGQVLSVNTTAPLGVEWVTPPSVGTLQQVCTAGNQTNTGIVLDAASTLTLNDVSNNYQGVISARQAVFTSSNFISASVDVDGAIPRVRFTQNSDSASISLGGNALTFNSAIYRLNVTSSPFTLNIDENTGFVLNMPLRASGISYPTVDGTLGQALVTDGTGNLVFSSLLPLTGGTMSGYITFALGQTFPGVIAEGSLAGLDPINVGGTLSNPIISVDTATTSQIGVVKPDGTTITIDSNGVISAASAASQTLQTVTDNGATTTNSITVASLTAAGLNYPTTDGAAGEVIVTDGAGNLSFAANLGANALPLTGGTMTGTITFAAGQTISGYVANTLYSTTGDIAYASSGNTPARLGIGAAGTILASNAGLPAWRTSAQLGLLTSATASSTYAPLDSPIFTGPVTVNAGAVPGGNGLIINDGNLVIVDAFTPASSSATGSTGEISWDNSYLYICVAPNTWGRVAIDLTPF